MFTNLANELGKALHEKEPRLVHSESNELGPQGGYRTLYL